MSEPKILAEKSNGSRDGKTRKQVVILVTSESDIPTEFPDGWETGSLCIIADSHTYKWLTAEGEWK